MPRNNEDQITPADFANYSPQQQEAIIEFKEHENYWKSCLGGSTDSRLLKFTVLHVIVVSLLIFSAVGLSRATSCEETSLYQSLLTFLLGLIINTKE
jgi:hypothetical protein